MTTRSYTSMSKVFSPLVPSRALKTFGLLLYLPDHFIGMRLHGIRLSMWPRRCFRSQSYPGWLRAASCGRAPPKDPTPQADLWNAPLEQASATAQNQGLSSNFVGGHGLISGASLRIYTTNAKEVREVCNSASHQCTSQNHQQGSCWIATPNCTSSRTDISSQDSKDSA